MGPGQMQFQGLLKCRGGGGNSHIFRLLQLSHISPCSWTLLICNRHKRSREMTQPPMLWFYAAKATRSPASATNFLALKRCASKFTRLCKIGCSAGFSITRHAVQPKLFANYSALEGMAAAKEDIGRKIRLLAFSAVHIARLSLASAVMPMPTRS